MIEKYKQLVGCYIRAKDRHQPHLMRQAFAENAILKTRVTTDAISFPAEVIGLDNITAVLVTDFHLKFDNVYTVCISDSAVEMKDELRCQWLVGMTDSESGSLRIGYGDYHWKFYSPDGVNNLRSQQLTIFIENMVILPVASACSVLSWLDSLSYPWVTIADLARSAPDLPVIHDFLQNKAVVDR